MTIPDAPWIRDAMINGVDEAPLPKCPVCGEECERFVIGDGEILGCENCTEDVDSIDWAHDHWEDEMHD